VQPLCRLIEIPFGRDGHKIAKLTKIHRLNTL